MKFSDALKYYRDRAGLNKKELAEKINVKSTYIIGIEKGRFIPPTFERCQQIARALELNDQERKKFFALAFEERLGEDADFLAEIDHRQNQMSDKELEKISKEVLRAIEDPVAVKALLITHKGSDDVKRALRQLLETFPVMSVEKRKAILALCQ